MRKLLLTISSVLLLLISAFAQNRTVTGRVTDNNGIAVPRASVVVKGSKSGTSTNANGEFTLSVPASASTLVISSIDMTSQQVAITGGSMTIALVAKPGNLQEVVVVGYGTKTIRENTGAISKISGSKISGEPVSSFDQALAGKTAGVQISLGSGLLADRTAIRIRGVNSISQQSQPLIVIDGIPQNDKTTNLNGFNSGNTVRFDPLQLINSNDIESIEVLKDAGASVIYGSRASNGVILITTKKGKKGSVKVSIDSKVGYSSASKLPPLLNADDFITIQNEKGANRFGAGTPYASMAKPNDIDSNGVIDNTNWNDYSYRRGLTYDNSISLSGGADKISVYGSARYLTQEGITLGNKLTSGQARLNLDITPKTWFKSGVQLGYSRTLNNGVLSDGFIAGTTVSGWQAPPNVSPFNPKGYAGYNLTANGLLGQGNNQTTVNGVNYLPSASYYLNIIPQIKLQRNDNTAEDLRASIYGEVQPVKGLKVTTKFATQYITNFEDQYGSPYVAGLGTSYGGIVQNQTQHFDQWIWSNYLNFDRTFGKNHKIGLVAGADYQKNKYFYLYTGASNFSDPLFQHVIDGSSTQTIPGQTTVIDFTGGNLRSSGLISYYGRLSYSYASKYFVEYSLRRDGFSGFGADNRFGNFPSISFGWDVTKEKFLENSRWINFLKLRGSYGEVGNSRGVGDYASLTTFSGALYTSLGGFTVSQQGNAGLHWETAKKTDVGFEMNVLNSKIAVIVDYFKTDINGLILTAPTLYTVGIPGSSISTNIGGMKNEGYEITLNATPVTTKDFSFTTSFNFTKIKNTVTGLVPSNNNADIAGTFNVASVGKPLGTFKLARWAGVDPASGNPQWFAADGTIKRYNFGAPVATLWTDDKGVAVSALSAADAVYLDKGGLPTFYGGWDNTFTYKQFDLGISMVYQGGNYVYNSSLAGMLTNQFSNNFDAIKTRWQKPGDVTDVPKLWLNDNTANQTSTRFLEKGDFLRVRTITFGYNFSRNLLSKIGFENIRFYVQAFNPVIFTKYKGLDPDVNTAGTTQSNIAIGIDSRGTPQARTITTGLNFTF